MTDLPHGLHQVLTTLLFLLPYALWFTFCLWCINWRKMRQVLVEGAWVPLTLLVILGALVWSQIAPSRPMLFGLVHAPNFWWQLVCVALLAGLGLFAGWVQEHYSWTPMEIAVEPPAHGHGHGHSHSHDHPHTHAHDHANH